MTELRSWDVPVADRFAWWSDLVDRSLVPCTLSRPVAPDFRASMALLALGRAQVSVLTFPSLRSTRTWPLIRRTDPELWQLVLVTGGRMGIEQHRSQAVVSAGDLLVYDTSHPNDSWVQAEHRPAGIVMLHLHRAVLPIPDRAMRSLAARRLPSESGMGAIVAGFLECLAGHNGTWAVRDSERLGSVTLNLAAAYLEGLAQTEGVVPPETRQAALLYEVKAFIERNLADPRLSPSMIADAHHMSVRSLHHLFREEKQTVSAFIRASRLERCVAELRNPDLAVRAVGARWGFPDPGMFSRVFKARYNVPPGEYRSQQGR
jgi:AraC-like DNA-binding protein